MEGSASVISASVMSRGASLKAHNPRSRQSTRRRRKAAPGMKQVWNFRRRLTQCLTAHSLSSEVVPHRINPILQYLFLLGSSHKGRMLRRFSAQEIAHNLLRQAKIHTGMQNHLECYRATEPPQLQIACQRTLAANHQYAFLIPALGHSVRCVPHRDSHRLSNSCARWTLTGRH